MLMFSFFAAVTLLVNKIISSYFKNLFFIISYGNIKHKRQGYDINIK